MAKQSGDQISQDYRENPSVSSLFLALILPSCEWSDCDKKHIGIETTKMKRLSGVAGTRGIGHQELGSYQQDVQYGEQLRERCQRTKRASATK